MLLDILTPISIPAFRGEPGSDAASLISEKLLLRPSAPDECPFRWLNLILRRGFAMLKTLQSGLV